MIKKRKYVVGALYFKFMLFNKTSINGQKYSLKYKAQKYVHIVIKLSEDYDLRKKI